MGTHSDRHPAGVAGYRDGVVAAGLLHDAGQGEVDTTEVEGVLEVVGACQNNLASIDVKIPKGQLVAEISLLDV
ncbi:MAG: hypothetical protein IH919_02795 [Deltaproteobacteria bacterium]|nr:hypothetical protein [Deltaproteobacteria bacterium]